MYLIIGFEFQLLRCAQQKPLKENVMELV